MKKLMVPMMLGFGVALALLIGRRMSTDAMAVVIGVAVGVAASVPTSLLLVALLRRERVISSRAGGVEAGGTQLRGQAPGALPSVVVLNASDLVGARREAPQIPMPPVGLVQDGGLRRLRVVGEDEWSDDGW
jgi:hypothetical protein